MDCSPSGSSVHGILQARILECVVVVGAKASVCPSMCWGHRAQVELCPQVPISELGAAGSSPLEQEERACSCCQLAMEGHILS